MAHQPLQICPDVFWVGAINSKLRTFDIIMPTEQGTTYNAYLVRGTKKTALIETVKHGFTEELFERIRAIVPLENIDYIICNHLEPDHSGSLLEAKAKMPKAQVVVSKNGKGFLAELFNQDLNPLAVGTGDHLELGGKTLEFITAPFLHWPDTMFTYLPEDQVLFSCDFLACHYSHDAMFSNQVGDFSYSFCHYFQSIMRPFKEYVLKGLDAIRDKPLRWVATSHGPILNHNIPAYLEQYRQWALEPKPGPKKRIAVFYVSAYGLTGQLAQAIAGGAQAAGASVAIFDLLGTSIGDILGCVESADGLAIGSCTINGDAVKPVWDLLSSLDTMKVKGKWAMAFGSYGWSGEAVPMLEERLKSLKFKLAAPGLKVKFTPNAEDLQAAHKLGGELVEKISA